MSAPRNLAFALVISTTAAYADASNVIASDDFDSPINLISYSAVDFEGNDPTNTGVWSSGSDNFGPRSVADFTSGGTATGNFVSDTLIDRTSAGESDDRGIIPLDYVGNFFAIVDTDNGANDTGGVTGTWVFDISSAVEVTDFEVDMAAIGSWFDNGSAAERFVWSYSIDGGSVTDLLTVRGDASLGSVTYTMADGTTLVAPGNTAAGDDDNGVSVNGVALLNELTTLSAPLVGSGSELTLELFGFINDNGSGLAFDNVAIRGVAVPEPSTAVIGLIAGLLGVAVRRR
ncbi:hypothetical protein MalM25_23870 [Planctomycetes bacterium MalM25]|nr:hypothetical protein MalM25_23870 [Planctomycetes bacterium MalM25]